MPAFAQCDGILDCIYMFRDQMNTLVLAFRLIFLILSLHLDGPFSPMFIVSSFCIYGASSRPI